MKPVSHNPDRIRVEFDDDRVVSAAGLMLPVTIGKRLGLETGFNDRVSGHDELRRPNAAAKAMTVIGSLLAGGEFISDVAMLSSGATGRVLGFPVISESRTGEWLRSLTHGDVAGLGIVNADMIDTGWQQGLGPDLEGTDTMLVLDVDSTHIETYGATKQGTRVRAYHGSYGYSPLLCTEASTGHVLAARLRDGNAAPARDAAEFLSDTFTDLRTRIGTDRTVLLRGDSGFYTKDVIRACLDHHVQFSITIRQQPPIRARIAAIDPTSWQRVETTNRRHVDIAAVDYLIKGRNNGDNPIPCRLIVRRTTTPADTGTPQPRLFDLIDYHAFVTDQPGNPTDLATRHRQHAIIESTIRDLKHGLALNHMPSARWNANAAWLHLNIIAHNLARFTNRTITPQPLTIKTLRYRYLTIPGRLTTTARTTTLHHPTNWPWATTYTTALTNARHLTAA